MAICWFLGVEPTIKPVFKSCEVVPPFDAAIQTMPPMESAVTKNGGAVQPMIRNTKHVSSNVATVIPEIGFEEEPISPVRRDETVTNRKPKATINNAPRMIQRRFRYGTTMMTSSITTMPPTTNFIERSRSVRGALSLATLVLRKSANPHFNPCQIVGNERTRLMMPPAATAPAPMYRM